MHSPFGGNGRKLAMESAANAGQEIRRMRAGTESITIISGFVDAWLNRLEHVAGLSPDPHSEPRKSDQTLQCTHHLSFRRWKDLPSQRNAIIRSNRCESF